MTEDEFEAAAMNDIELKQVKGGYYSGSYRGEHVSVRKASDSKWWVFSSRGIASGRSKKEAVLKFLAKAASDELQELQK